MSLLLDALKKAAAEKNKKAQNSNAKKTNNNVKQSSIDYKKSNKSHSLNDMDMDLELHSESKFSSTNDTILEDFPVVDKSIEKKSKNSIDPSIIKKQPYITTQLETTTSKNINNEKQLHITTDELDTTKTSITNQVVTTENISHIKPEKEEHKKSHINKLDNEILTKEFNPTAIENPTKNENDKRINSESALTELINKSNKYTKYKTIKQRILIGIICTTIISATGVYFYFKINISNKNLYLTDEYENNINYNLSNQSILKESPISSVKVEKPITKKPTTIKPTKSSIKTTNYTRKLVAKNTTEKKPINFIKTIKYDPINILIRNAYNEFHNKNYNASKKLYKKALSSDIKNRDALLGLSAIAIKNNNYEYARQKYLYLLKLNPRDSVAIAGLSSLSNSANTQLSESQLKFFLKQQPNASHLHFALGTLFSNQKKWPEAQSAYFNAWSSDNKNPDYTYNLAISLDHLNKKKQALKFYLLSLKLQTDFGGNFSENDIQTRIQILKMEMP